MVRARSHLSASTHGLHHLVATGAHTVFHLLINIGKSIVREYITACLLSSLYVFA